MTACPDCPDMLAENMPPGWTPRARCCRDEHLDRRLDGSVESWQGIEVARARSEAVSDRRSRQVRRAEERDQRKRGGAA